MESMDKQLLRLSSILLTVSLGRTTDTGKLVQSKGASRKSE